MALHLPTLLSLLTLTCVVLGGSVLFVAWRTRLHAGLAWWGWGLVANALSYPAFGLRYLGAPEASILLTNLLSPLTLALQILAVQRYQQGRAQLLPPIALWAPVVLSVTVAAVWVNDDRTRNVITALLLMLQSGALGWQAWGPALQGHRVAGRWLVVLGAGGLAATMLMRIGFMVTVADWSGPLRVPASTQSLTYLMVLIALLTNTIGFVLMQMERAVDVQHDLATHDPLTGAANRRELMEVFGRSLALAHRGGRSLALLMIDIDFFKRVNDTYGHQTGDAVLREVARRVQARLRRQDLLARFGGEEFIVLLPDTDADGALTLAESVRQAIAAEPVVAGAHQIPLTISIGVHGRMLADTPTAQLADQMIGACDRAVYQAKAAGRNRVAAET